MTSVVEKISFCTATEADLPFLLELRQKTMSEHLRQSGVEPSERERVERVLARFECARIILLSGTPIGLLKVSKDEECWDLIQIQIVPEKQGSGLGSGILKKLLAEAVQANACVKLSVLRSNRARRIYERLGFKVVGENAHAYEMQFRA
jgi:ribosomal protein S18 acetylase RimI-like enzyme